MNFRFSELTVKPKLSSRTQIGYFCPYCVEKSPENPVLRVMLNEPKDSHNSTFHAEHEREKEREREKIGLKCLKYSITKQPLSGVLSALA